MEKIDKELLSAVSGLHNVPRAGVFNIRHNGKLLSRNTDSDVKIVTKPNKDGIDVIINPNVKGKSIHIPVIISQAGVNDLVYNDFYVGDNCDILIVAGCGIHSTSTSSTSHDGIHSFHIGNNCNVRYVERHVGLGENDSPKVLNPVTKVNIKSNSTMTMETVQLGGVTYSKRTTKATIGNNSKLIVNEKLLTNNNDHAETYFNVNLKGTNSKVEVISRGVASGNSRQIFNSSITGKAPSFGHVECDGIISDNATISSTPTIVAAHPDAMLTHEAAIGKISVEQQNKLMTLGLTAKQAEDAIIKGFLK